ncbi:MAG: tRNA lysidine(34) synthetase TilS [Anaerofustis sp.]
MQKHLLKEEDGILIALSGGSDSVFLLCMFKELQPRLKLRLHAFHLNHMMRESAQRDEAFVSELCRRWNIPCDIVRSDIPRFASEGKISSEEAGRMERYRLMEELLCKYQLQKAATAHHADDQTETVLMRVIRGTGLHGLSGIPEQRGHIIRPLLAFRKQEMIEYLNENGIEYMHDETNESDDYFRNRIRNRVIPLLEKENPNLADSLLSLSRIAANADLYFKEIAEELSGEYSTAAGTFPYEIFGAQKRSVQEYLLRKMMTDIGCSEDIGFGHIELAITKIAEHENTVWELHLPNCTLKRTYGMLIATKGKPHVQRSVFRYPVGSKGSYLFPNEGFLLRMERVKKIEKNLCNRYIKAIDYDKIEHNLTIGNRSEGDFFYPLGTEGKKSLKKYFIDQKIPKDERMKIPILFDGDCVVCIFGWEIDHRYRITDRTERCLQLEYIPTEE